MICKKNLSSELTGKLPTKKEALIWAKGFEAGLEYASSGLSKLEADKKKMAWEKTKKKLKYDM